MYTPLRSPIVHRSTRRDKMLMYGFVVSVIGLPIGIILGLPVVWSLAILGILIGGFKLVMRRPRK